MAGKIRLKTVEVMLLVLVWVVLIASPLLFRADGISELRELIAPLETIVPLFIIFILNRFVLVPKLLFRNKNLLYFISVFGLIALFTLGSYFVTTEKILDRPGQTEFLDPPRHLPPDARPPDNNRSHPGEPERGGPIPPFANLLIFSILMVGFDTGLKISFKLAQTEREKAVLETENVATQLAFLRNQISPHFFMNTLNNIHAQIDINTEEAKESVIRLSRLMRHLIYDSEAESIPLKKELEFLSNYVDLMSLRYSDKIEIDLDIPATLPEKTIPPLLFTSFIENAFKHGISYEKPSFIKIIFRCNKEELAMEVRNSNNSGDRKNEASGIGIENSRKRLDLIYGDTYKLDIQSGGDVHIVRLKIPL
ncbi:MAG: histidine kinase [Bacteroidales bacterium]|nr:histidine kinase [Bacteroidales bacterium]